MDSQYTTRKETAFHVFDERVGPGYGFVVLGKLCFRLSSIHIESSFGAAY